MEEIYIGSKGLRAYIMACIQGLSNEDAIKILARGTNVKKAIDVAEIVRRQTTDLESVVNIDSEEYNDRYVSTIAITLKPENLKIE